MADLLEFKIPFVTGVSLPRQSFNCFKGYIFEFLPGPPRLFQGLLDLVRRKIHVGQKFIVCPVLAIGRLLCRHGQDFFKERDIEMEQEGAVKQKKAAFPVLGIARKFAHPEGKVGVTLNFDSPADQGIERLLERSQDERVRSRDVPQRISIIDPQNQRIIEAPGTLENGTAAAASPENGDAAGLARSEVNFGMNLAGVP